MTKRYEVQHYTLCDGWINTWSDYDEDGNETPSTYDSFEDALNELDSFLDDEQEAFEEGNIESPAPIGLHWYYHCRGLHCAARCDFNAPPHGPLGADV